MELKDIEKKDLFKTSIQNLLKKKAGTKNAFESIVMEEIEEYQRGVSLGA